MFRETVPRKRNEENEGREIIITVRKHGIARPSERLTQRINASGTFSFASFSCHRAAGRSSSFDLPSRETWTSSERFLDIPLHAQFKTRLRADIEFSDSSFSSSSSNRVSFQVTRFSGSKNRARRRHAR